MPRRRSPQVATVKAKLLARLRDGFHRPGQRFFSNRGLARMFGLSYQTAHRLIAELESEGVLERRAASGTYVAGPRTQWTGVELLFHERARRADSFGARLLERLGAELEWEKIPHRVKFVRAGSSASDPKRYPVVWECRELAERMSRVPNYVLLLNDRSPPGLGACFVDSVSTDDFSGGASAAEVLRRKVPRGRLAVFSGPAEDERSRQRVAGFLANVPDARVLPAETWYVEKARTRAADTLRYAGVFCCNDRLAEAVIQSAAAAHRSPPVIVGFDDAPISEQLNFTTIAIPWKEIVEGAVRIIRRRLAGDSGLAAQLIFAPRPIIRSAEATTGQRSRS